MALVVSLSVLLIVSISIAIYNQYRNHRLLASVTTEYRGTQSERKLILKLLKLGFEPIAIYHDLYVKKITGKYSQIDVVVLTKVGIIVFEVKDYKGWIFGKGYQRYWTQVLAYGREKYRFYNPVLQNQGHICALKSRLRGLANVPFYSISVFYGKCKLRNISYIPQGATVCYPSDVASIINNILTSNQSANYVDKWGVVSALQEAVANGGNPNVVQQHRENVNQISKRYKQNNQNILYKLMRAVFRF